MLTRVSLILLALLVVGCGDRNQSQLSGRQVVLTSIPASVAVGPADAGRAILVEFGSLLCGPSRHWAETVLPEVQGESGTDLEHWYVDITPPGDVAVAAGIAARLITEHQATHVLIVSTSAEQDRQVNHKVESELKALGVEFLLTPPVPVEGEPGPDES